MVYTLGTIAGGSCETTSHDELEVIGKELECCGKGKGEKRKWGALEVKKPWMSDSIN